MSARYYAFRLLGEADPSGIFRFFADKTTPPERYDRKEKRWVPEGRLWGRIASGEIGRNDVISKEAADQLIAEWANA